MKNNRDRKPSRITQNTTAKIISLIFAIVFWTYVMDQVNPEMTKDFNNVAVAVIGVEDLENQGLVMLGKEDYSVGVSVRGRRSDIIGFDKEDLKLSADITGYSPGINTIPIEKTSLIESVSITNLTKPDIKVELDRLISLPKPVVVEEVGTVTPGYQLSDINQSKAEVIVRGAESFVSRVAAVRGMISINEITEDFKTEVSLIPVDFEDNEVRGVTLSAYSMEVSYEAFRMKTLPLVAVFEGQVDENHLLTEVQIKPVSVVARGKPATIEALKELTLASLDITGVTEDFEYEVAVDLPQGVSLPYSANQVKVAGRVELIETKEMVFDLGEIAMVNLPENFVVNILDTAQEIRVILRDTGDNLNAINRADLELVLDLSGLEPGDQAPELGLNLDMAVHEYRLSQDSLAIELVEAEE